MSSDSIRDKLGVALAGGGFRATLFHIGVLRRLADLDLLRHVEVISAVSGGAITATLYALLLKRELEQPQYEGKLSQACYRKIVDDLEVRLCLGIQKDLRTRLFMNPFNQIIDIATGDHLTRAMARLYDRHLLRETIEELSGQAGRRGEMSLNAIKIRPAGKAIDLAVYGDIDGYNAAQLSEQDGSVITKLILNATSLNSGARFWFSASEIGEWDNGYLYHQDWDEISKLKQQIEQARTRGRPPADRCCEPETALHWYLSAGDSGMRPARWQALFDSWEAHFTHTSTANDKLDALLHCKLGNLRLARRAAWYLAQRLRGGCAAQELAGDHNFLTLSAKLGYICHQYIERVEAWLKQLADARELQALCTLVEDVYLVRSADRLDASAGAELAAFPLSHAVAASANFPPVFSPFQLNGIYDNLHVSRLGLTDGGVYDNLGVIGLIDEGCNHIISSDTGLSGETKRRVSTGRIGMMARIVTILTDSDARETRELLLERHQISAGLGRIPCDLEDDPTIRAALAEALREVHATRELYNIASFKIGSASAGETDAQANERAYPLSDVANIRTDLDAFGDIEIDALINQGYANCGASLKRWFDMDRQANVPRHLTCRYHKQRAIPYPYQAVNGAAGDFPKARTSCKTPAPALQKQTLAAARFRIPRILFIRSSGYCYLAWVLLLGAIGLLWLWLGERTINLEQTLQSAISQLLLLRELGLDGEISGRRLLRILVLIVLAPTLIYLLMFKKWFAWIDEWGGKGYRKTARALSSAARLPRLVRAFISVMFFKLLFVLPAWIVYGFSRLYLRATNLGPRGKSCRCLPQRETSDT
jgi:predicted acylesterase/phospholipase RssA